MPDLEKKHIHTYLYLSIHPYIYICISYWCRSWPENLYKLSGGINEINLFVLKRIRLQAPSKLTKLAGFKESISRHGASTAGPYTGCPWVLVPREGGTVGSTSQLPQCSLYSRGTKCIWSSQASMIFLAEGR